MLSDRRSNLAVILFSKTLSENSILEKLNHPIFMDYLPWKRNLLKTLKENDFFGKKGITKFFPFSNNVKNSIKVKPPLTLPQTTNSRLFQAEKVCRRLFQIWWKWQRVHKRGRKKHWEKEKLLVTSNFSFSHGVFKRLVLRSRKSKNKDLFGNGLICGLQIFWIWTRPRFCLLVAKYLNS